MDPLWIAVAFVLGFAARQVGLPPLVGFLVAGFVLNAFGAESGEALQHIADLGVTLLLFSIGCKLRVRSLLRPEIWAGTSIHMLITVVVFGAAIFGLSAAGLSLFAELDLKLSLLIAFALSFSSTVFAVKVLEERGDVGALHGRTAIGILIMEDIIAVVFLAASAGKVPSVWAFVLVPAFLIARPILMAILSRAGHGELLILMGVLLTMAGDASFEAVRLKGDLGALAAGALIASHPKAPELAKALLSFKDLFLVGFFLNIGLQGPPSVEVLVIAGVLVLAVPFKVALFFLLLARFRLRARTATLASLSLANYSEFGLIVGAVGLPADMREWLVIVAIALSITFILASPLNSAAHAIYSRLDRHLRRFESAIPHPEEQPVDLGDAEILVFGMGRLGAGAYEAMRQRFADAVVGVDFDAAEVARQQAAGRNVVHGDATDVGFWQRLDPARIRLVMLAMPDHAANLTASTLLTERGYTGHIAAVAGFDDQVAQLEQAGAHAAFNAYREAGTGFADDVCARLEDLTR
ncbi:MAG: cation:proton antiporter domain-containing protein [Planctomycetota bacterium]